MKEEDRTTESGETYEYVYENGLRRVVPYYYTHQAHAKARWIGQTIGQLYTTEFNYTRGDIERMTGSGSLRVNGERVGVDYAVKDGDFVSNRIHRHEPPTRGDRIGIVEDNEDFVVVDKPGTVPVHPCGMYRFNSLLYILGRENGLSRLKGVHRIDRVTSGLVVLAKNGEICQKLAKLFLNRKVRKEYLCRVRGCFPRDLVSCDEPVGVFSHYLGLSCVDRERGKPARTIFELVGRDGEESVVKCTPYTGRTHQIRVHLQFLGFPIADDWIYGNADIFGAARGRGGQFDREEVRQNYSTMRERLRGDASTCDECGEPLLEVVSPGISLHAWRCSFWGREFCAGPPDWARGLVVE